MAEELQATSIRDQMRASQRIPISVNDPFGHGVYCMTAEPGKAEPDTIIGKMELLGNIASDQLLRIYQRDVKNQMSYFYMSEGNTQIDREIRAFYYFRNANFRAELGLTRTKDGLERNLQGGPGGYTTNRPLYGFGNQLQTPFDPNQQQKQPDLLARIFKPQQQQPQQQQPQQR